MRLQTLRQQRQLTRSQLDFALDLAPGTLERWELGGDSPKAGELVTLAQQLSVPVCDLLLGPATHGETSSAVHTPELDRFLMTEVGRRAIEAGLVQMLLILPSSFTADHYQRIVEDILEAESLIKPD